jgi:hypothetical protein
MKAIHKEIKPLCSNYVTPAFESLLLFKETASNVTSLSSTTELQLACLLLYM